MYDTKGHWDLANDAGNRESMGKAKGVQCHQHYYEEYERILGHIARMSAGSDPQKPIFQSGPKVVAIDEIC